MLQWSVFGVGTQ